MATLPSLRSLYDRVCKAEGPDAELDRLVSVAASKATAEWQEYKKDWAYHRDGFWVYVEMFPVTASLDAITALIERELPGWSGDLDIGEPFARDKTFGARLFPPNSLSNIAGTGATPALALTAAFLAACIAMREAENADQD